jgi:hypothetical protein
LEKLQSIQNENFELQKKLIREIKKNKEKSDYIKELKSDLKIINSEQDYSQLGNVKFEHSKLLETAHSISEEVKFKIILVR